MPRFFAPTTLIQIIVPMRHPQPQVEIIVSAEEVNDFFATNSGTNVVSAFDGALNQIEIQLEKHKKN
ncbi:MAG: HPF/RaiA family ribosome-associated protein [Planctomycetota bacterium]|nr:HPF/RaiA family ribosome-associated protein [Planctomycetota bacterium]